MFRMGRVEGIESKRADFFMIDYDAAFGELSSTSFGRYLLIFAYSGKCMELAGGPHIQLIQKYFLKKRDININKRTQLNKLTHI